MLKSQKSAVDVKFTAQYNKLVKAREEAFQLREEIKLLRDEVAHNRLKVDQVKSSQLMPQNNIFVPRMQIKLDVYGQELIIPLGSQSTESGGDTVDGYTTEVVRRILAAKDQGLVSDKAYHELRMALPEDIRARIPPLSAIQTKTAAPTPDNESSSEEEDEEGSIGAIAIYDHNEEEG